MTKALDFKVIFNGEESIAMIVANIESIYICDEVALPDLEKYSAVVKGIKEMTKRIRALRDELNEIFIEEPK